MTGPQRVRITGSMYHPQVPAGAVTVARPTRWGNPHPMGRSCPACGGAVHGTRRTCVDLYRRDLLADPDRLARARLELAGRDLACWCPIGEPCHGDALLQLVNDGGAP